MKQGLFSEDGWACIVAYFYRPVLFFVVPVAMVVKNSTCYRELKKELEEKCLKSINQVLQSAKKKGQIYEGKLLLRMVQYSEKRQSLAINLLLYKYALMKFELLSVS